MSDRLTLSCWLRNFHPLTVLANWEKLLLLFPYSKLAQGPATLRIQAVAITEPELLEQAFPAPFDPEPAIAVSREFQYEDGAYQLDCSWDLLVWDEEWRMAPVKVSLWCFAPQFENETSDHVRIELGPEDTFLPRPGDDASIRAAHANLRSLTRLIQDIADKLPVERQHLSSESGVNFAEKLERAVAGGSGGLALQ
ncbi:MAG TPA: hypothetical protein VM120_05665 [Bryobacteraceae bacterium]|nr:hypothetical protein [Bryobacteraceae bacterium]